MPTSCVHFSPNVPVTGEYSLNRENLSHTTFIECPVVLMDMYAVSTAAARTVGRTRFDSVFIAEFGNFTSKLTAPGTNANGNDWCANQSVRDCLSSHPQAPGYGHRP